MYTVKSLVWIVNLVLLTAAAAYGYAGEGHRQITQTALRIFASSDATTYGRFLELTGSCPEIRGIRTREPSFLKLPLPEMLIAETPAVDEYRDIEIVKVRGGIGGTGRDNPHRDDSTAVEDVPSTARHGMSFTAFNHFIDLRKGPGVFDDYDGYSYRNGSGSVDQRQKAAELATSWSEKLAANATGFKVDEAINWWFSDAYVHVPGQPWYHRCSPAMDRYSFYQDRHRYASKPAELTARFPLASATATAGQGVPYSVFMPVDNLARYWYGRCTDTGDALALAPVMHAIQDASIPHHAAGCMGNWHSRYESDLESRMAAWVGEAEFADQVKALVGAWSRERSPSPASLQPGDWVRVPSSEWRVDQLVTWVALNAFAEYRETYDGFAHGYRLNEASARRLAQLATAMSVLVLQKAVTEAPAPAAR